MELHEVGCIAKIQTVGHSAFHTLLYLEKGRIRLRIGDAVWEVEKREAFLLLPGVFAEMVGTEASAEGGYILFTPFADTTKDGILYPDESGRRQMRAILSNGKGDLEDLFRHLLSAPQKTEKDLAGKIRAYVRENLHTKLSVKTTAADLGITAPKLGAVCKEKFGLGFLTYVNRVRMENAKFLLQNKKLKISDITKRLGYTSVQYFSICFKKEMGMTPSDFRKYFKI